MKALTLVRTIILAGSLLLQLSTLCFHSDAAPGDVDLSFDAGSGVNGTVTVVVVQPDGKVIIGGDFTTVKGLTRAGLARLNADGSGDSSFNPPAGGLITAVALQADGKVLAGNYATITRFNSNGSLDASFNTSVNDVLSIAVQPDGKILIGGKFYTVNGTPRTQIARLNPNGSLDSSFNPGTATLVGNVISIGLQPDGKVMVGGGGKVVRLNANGTLDASFTATFSGPIFSVMLQGDGKVLVGVVGHSFTRLNVNGTSDTNFNPGPITYGVAAIALQPDGKVVITRKFIGDFGATTNDVVRLNSNGGLDNSFTPAIFETFAVNSIAVQSNGRILVGGSFERINGTNCNNLVRLYPSGGLDGSFDPGSLGFPVSAIVAQPDGGILVGDPRLNSGVFTFINGTNRYGTARLNSNGSVDSTFMSGTNFQPDLQPSAGVVYSVPTSMAVQPDGKVLVNGYHAYYVCDEFGENCFYSYAGFSIRLYANGSYDPGFNPAVVGNFIASQPDGKILAGGGSGRIVRLNSNGTLDGSFDPGTGIVNPNYYDARIKAVAVQSDGKILIAGDFISFNGTSRNGIARLNSNGSLDSSFDPGLGATDDSGNWPRVRALALQANGKVLIGGYFTKVNGTNRNHLARLNANGSLDASFDPGTGTDGAVQTIALQPDGKVLIGGDSFNTVNGVTRPHIARLYGDFVAPPPSLSIARSNASVIISWPSPSTGFTLQQNTSSIVTVNWSNVLTTPTDNGTTKTVIVNLPMGNRFYRLKSQ
jgi:uncharacterized delta-60 repeat protein